MNRTKQEDAAEPSIAPVKYIPPKRTTDENLDIGKKNIFQVHSNATHARYKIHLILFQPQIFRNLKNISNILIL